MDLRDLTRADMAVDGADNEVTIQEEFKTEDNTVKQGKPPAYVGYGEMLYLTLKFIFIVQ